MCRGFVENERENLKIKAFYIQLTVSRASVPPDFLTLHFLPRISGGRLEINGSSIRPDSPAFVTLHRVVSGRGFKYGSRERVTVCEGARFEIYVGDVKIVKGVFRKLDDGDDWKMDCKCVLSAAVRGVGGAEVEVEVAPEGLAGVMTEKVEMVAAVRRPRSRRCCEMEEIPEVREEEGACCCSECGGADGAGDGEMEVEVDVDVEPVNWAVDVGIWVVCLGLGYMVSASSFKRLRRKRFI